MVTLVNILQTEITIDIYSNNLIRAIDKEILLKFEEKNYAEVSHFNKEFKKKKKNAYKKRDTN